MSPFPSITQIQLLFNHYPHDREYDGEYIGIYQSKFPTHFEIVLDTRKRFVSYFDGLLFGQYIVDLVPDKEDREILHALVPEEIEEWTDQLRASTGLQPRMLGLSPCQTYVKIMGCLREELSLCGKYWGRYISQLLADSTFISVPVRIPVPDPVSVEMEDATGDFDDLISFFGRLVGSEEENILKLTENLEQILTSVKNWVDLLVAYVEKVHSSHFYESEESDWERVYQEDYTRVLDSLLVVKSTVSSVSATYRERWSSLTLLGVDSARLEELSNKVDSAISRTISTMSIKVIQQPKLILTSTEEIQLVALTHSSVRLGTEGIAVKVLTAAQAKEQAKSSEILLGGKLVSSKGNKGTGWSWTFTKDELPVANIKNMTLCLRKELESSTSSVFKKTFYYLFHSTAYLEGNDNPIPIRALSAPFALKSHSNQHIMCYATVYWQRCVLYHSPHADIECPAKKLQLRTGFRRFFKDFEVGKTKWTLNGDNVDYLMDSVRDFLGRGQFDGDRILLENIYAPNEKALFWNWFTAALTLISNEPVNEIFAEGHILGFVGKNRAKELVMAKRGQSCLRFASSDVGKLCLTWYPLGSDSPVKHYIIQDFENKIIREGITNLASVEKLLGLGPDPSTETTFYTRINKFEAFPQDNNDAQNIITRRLGYEPPIISFGCDKRENTLG